MSINNITIGIFPLAITFDCKYKTIAYVPQHANEKGLDKAVHWYTTSMN